MLCVWRSCRDAIFGLTYRRPPSGGLHCYWSFKGLLERVAVHLDEELRVVGRLLETALEEFHGLDGVHVGQVVAQEPDAVDVLRIVEQVVAAGGAEGDVHSREDALVGELPVELQLEVACALEFLENHVVHLGTGLGEGGSQNGK